MTRLMRSSSVIDLVSIRTPDLWQRSAHGKANGALQPRILLRTFDAPIRPMFRWEVEMAPPRAT